MTIYRTRKSTKSSPKSSPKNSPKVPQKISDGALKTFEELKKNPGSTSADIAEVIGLTSRAVKKHFAVLKELGLIEYVGGKKNGYWIIKDGI